MFVWLIVHDVRCHQRLYICMYMYWYVYILCVYMCIYCIYGFTQEWVTIESPRFMILVDQRVSWWFLAFEHDVHVTL